MSERRHPPEVLLTEVASFFHLVGGIAPRHLVIIGGLTPHLLVPDAADPHRGSGDLDLALTVAITKGETADYYRSLEAKISRYFELHEGGFRWRKRDDAPGIPLLVDFLAPEVEATQLEDGMLQLEGEGAAGNVGSYLRPLPLRAARLVDADACEELVEGVSLVYEEGVRADVRIRYTGPVGFLASKADALAGRSEDKDGYDVAWWCLNAAGDPVEVAQIVMDRPSFRDDYFPESLQLLRMAFGARDYVGPSGYAQERNPDLSPGDEAYESDRNAAFLAVSTVVDKLVENLWKGSAEASHLA